MVDYIIAGLLTAMLGCEVVIGEIEAGALDFADDAADSLNESGLTVGDGVGPYDGIFDADGNYIG